MHRMRPFEKRVRLRKLPPMDGADRVRTETHDLPRIRQRLLPRRIHRFEPRERGLANAREVLSAE